LGQQYKIEHFPFEWNFGLFQFDFKPIYIKYFQRILSTHASFFGENVFSSEDNGR
jgi:hypothetical protein